MRFSDYLLDVETLIEGKADYVNMFNDFIGTEATPDEVAQTGAALAGLGQVREAVDRYITWARKNLKKNDRIVWFLRWVRVELAGRIKHTDSENELARLNKRLRTDFGRQDLVPINNLMTNLVHYLGMPIKQIQDMPWAKQSPHELLEEFGEIERDWKEANANNSNLIDYQEGNQPTVVMKFPDGYAWFDLEQSHCSREAAAMGHCGNAGGGGTILSLRRLAKSVDGHNYWYPVLTFILEHDGYLGEMKGRNNDKPIEKYHPYIIALLRDYDAIEGIRGGGYLPEHNFMMSDLDHDVAAELKKLKPGLADVDDIYQAEGMTKRVIGLINQRLPNGLSTGTYYPDEKAFLVNEWTDLGNFLQHGVYDEDAEKIYDIATGEADFVNRKSDVKTSFIETLLELPDSWQEKFVARAGLRHANRDPDQLVIDAGNKLMNSQDDWYMLFEDIHNSTHIIQEEAWERLAEYIDVGWSFAGNVYTNLPSGLDELKKFVENKDNVKLWCDERIMVGYATAGSDDDDEYAYELARMRGESGHSASWEEVDYENTSEHRMETGIYGNGQDRWNKSDTWLKGADTTSHTLSNDYLNALQGNPKRRIDDPRQSELSFESRLLKLAGLR